MVLRPGMWKFGHVSQRQALVTGATGFIASHLLPALLGEDWQVRACGRRPRPDWFPEEVDYRSVDLADSNDLGELYEGTTHLFHLAGASSSNSTDEEMHRFNVVATRNLLAAAPPELERVLYMSSTSVYGEEVQLPLPVSEDVQPNPSRAYGKAKWETEQEVWARAEEGTSVVVVRPVSVFGPANIKLLGSAVLDTAVEAWAGREALIVHTRPVEQRLVHIDDLVRATMHLAEHQAAAGHAFNVVADEYPSSLDVAGILAGAFGLELELSDDRHCGPGYEERAAAHRQMLEHGMRPDILLTEQRFRFMGKANRNNRLSIDALSNTGFELTHGHLEPAIRETIGWYREHRWVITR